MKAVMIIALCLATTAQAHTVIDGSGISEMEPILSALADTTRNPRDVQFRKLRWGGYCLDGEINIPNIYGGYNGFQSFILDMRTRDLSIIDIHPPAVMTHEQRGGRLTEINRHIAILRSCLGE